jgi:hypothetical protein
VREFVLANGDVVRRRLAAATFEYQGQRGDSLVIVGEPGAIRCSAQQRSGALVSCLTHFVVSCVRCSSR